MEKLEKLEWKNNGGRRARRPGGRLRRRWLVMVRLAD